MSRPAKLLVVFPVLLLIWIVYNYRLIDREVDNTDNTNLPGELDKDTQVANYEEPPPPPKRVRLDVYYECLCPDSRYFVLQNLVPAREKLGDILDIKFWPYGKADTALKPGGGYSFSCQHGEEECRGDIYHACVTRLIDNQAEQLDLIKCMISDNFEPEKVARRCLEKIKGDHNDFTLSRDRLDACATGRQGPELHAEAGLRSKGLSPAVSFIPTVEIEGSQQGQKQILKNLTKEICRVYQAKYKELPAECVMEL